MNSSLAATIDSLVRTPAGRFHMWAGASRSLERFRLLRYRGLGANVHVARSHVLIVKKENSGRVTLNVEELYEVFILAMNDVYFLCLRQHVT